LEIGLQEDYNALNIKYDPNINKYFSCTLKLLADSSEETFDVTSNSDSLKDVNDILNYTNLPEP